MTKPEKLRSALPEPDGESRGGFDCRSVSWNVRRLAAVRRVLERSPMPAGLCASPPRGSRPLVARKPAPAAPEIRLPAPPRTAVPTPAAPPACHLDGRAPVPLQRQGLQPAWLYDRER